MRCHLKRTPTWTALVAVWALLVQAILTGLADGAIAAPATLDGTVICVHGDGATHGVPGQPANRSELPDCCLSGCTMAGGDAALSASAIVLPPSLAPRTGVIPTVERHVATSFAYSPLNPRAPPRAG